jgi:predicted Zn-dependent protease
VSCLIVMASVCASREPAAYARAKALIREGEVEQGVALLKPLLESQPRNLKALNLLGIALTAKGDLDAANRQFARALEIDPSFYPALKNLALNEFNLKNVTASERHLKQALRFAATDPVIHAYLGRIALERRDYPLAARHLTRAGPLLYQDPALAADLVQSQLEAGRGTDALGTLAMANLGRAPLGLQLRVAVMLAQHGHCEEALPLFEAARVRDPDSYDVGFDLGICYVETRRFQQAIGLLRGLRDSGHTTADLDNLLAEAFEGAQMTQEALDALREATLLAPDVEENYLDLAVLCVDHEAYDLGLEVLEAGLSQRPRSDRLLLQRGVLYALKGEIERADESFLLAAALAPDKNLAQASMSIAHLQIDDAQTAVRALRRRVEERPDDPLLQYLLGKALLQSAANPDTAQMAEAEAALELSVRLNGSFAPSRAELGRLYLKTQRIGEAVAMLEKSLEMDPKDQATCAQLGTAYLRQGRPDRAAQISATLAKLNTEQWAAEAHRRLRLVKQESRPDD